jgi:Flp pilus assembly protein TadG
MRQSLIDDRRGSTALTFALSLPLLIGAAGLAVDTISWVQNKRQLQRVADSAAMAGVYALIQGDDADDAVDHEVTRNQLSDPNLSTELTYSPEGRDGDPMAIGVQLTTNSRLAFTSFFLRNPFAITASAVATVVDTGDYCALALDTGLDTAVLFKRDSSAELECGILANSSGPASIAGEVGAKVTTTKLLSNGGITGPDLGISPARSYGLKQKDPLANLAVPDVPDSVCPNTTVNANSQRTGSSSLKPGCYGNLVLNGPVELAAGDYILNHGNLVIGPNADVTCSGCTIFLTSDQAGSAPSTVGKVEISKLAKVNLTAPQEGIYSGILIYQDQRAAPEVTGEENVLSGGSTSKLDGIIYLPSQSLVIDASMSPDLRCARRKICRLYSRGSPAR